MVAGQGDGCRAQSRPEAVTAFESGALSKGLARVKKAMIYVAGRGACEASGGMCDGNEVEGARAHRSAGIRGVRRMRERQGGCPKDDGNPCTADMCEGGVTLHEALPAGSICYHETMTGV